MACCFYCAAMLSNVAAFAQKPGPRLDRDDVWLLVMNTPLVLEVEAREGCPGIEFDAETPDRMYVLVRNTCPKAGNGTMGSYVVDLRDGRVWFDMESDMAIDSDRLRRLTKILLSRQELRRQCGDQK